MKVKAIALAGLLLAHQLVSGQYIEKKWLDKNDPVYGFYTVVPPASGRVQGMLVLLDGFGGNADGFFAETKIHNVAWANDLLVVAIPTGRHLYLDSSMSALLNTVLKEVVQAYGLRKDKVAIGGMSSGGTIAVRYAELCHATPAAFPILPKAVFDIDSPLDLAGLYQSSARDLKKNNGGWWLGEAEMIVDKLKGELGDPAVSLSRYQQVSPFVKAAPDSVNEKLLSGTAVRSYHDVDVSWYIKNRGRSLYETNMVDGSEWISRLVNTGNRQAEFVSAAIPGRRSNGTLHPHSWNIAEEIDLVQWLKEKLNFYPDHLENPFVYTPPAGWATEVIPFPIDFAPQVGYKGFETLYFAPGWGKEKSDEKWAYTLLWWLDSSYTLTEKIVAADLENYFSGLTLQRAQADKLDMSLYKKAKADTRRVKTVKGDLDTYAGSIAIFDAQVTKKPATLYVRIHVKDCTNKKSTIVLIEVAGTPFDQPVWIKLDRINEDFRCVKEPGH